MICSFPFRFALSNGHISLNQIIMLRFIIILTLSFIFYTLQAQRGGNLSELTPTEIKQKKYEDSMQRLRDDFEQNFSATEYFKRLREIKLKNDSIQLNETLVYFKEIEPTADTLTELTIQSSALSVFPESIRNFRKLKSLTLRRCHSVSLEKLFEQIKDLPLLEELHIVFSEKAKLPENIGLLTRVKTLNLNGNKLNVLPENMAKMSSLQSINLHNNPYLDFDASVEVLSKIKSLKSIKASGCKLSTIGDGIGKLTQIESLDLNLNSIKTLPNAIDGMSNLKHINLSKNNQLNSIQLFSSISKLPKLEKIEITDCALKEISPAIGSLTQIKVLDASNNPLEKIPNEIGNLTSLEELYLGTHTLTTTKIPLNSIPTSIGQCTQLKKIDLRFCSIAEFPASMSQLTNLQYLDASQNKLTEFPKFLKSLTQMQYLDLSHNKINQFPDDIGTLALSLEVLMIEANFISPFAEKINNIPPSIARFKNLKKLSLKDQVYEKLPLAFWTNLTKMEELNLMGALLQEIPEEIKNMTELTSLNVKSNEIKSVPMSLAELKKLKEFNISYNPDINKTQLIDVLKLMPHIQHLNISYNDIKRVEIEELAKLLASTKIIKLETKDSPAYEKLRK